MLPPPQPVLAAMGACEGTPAAHRSCVQALPSSGTSLSSGDTRGLPWPSHSLTLQSPATCTGVSMPAALFRMPQTFWMQVRVRQSPSDPGQSAAVRQPTQRPCPSHSCPPPHIVLAAVGGLDGRPAVQTSCVHGLPSTGRSLLSMIAVTFPWPSQRRLLQSPAACSTSTVCAATSETPHAPPRQVRWLHSVSWPGQVAAVRQSTQIPAALQAPVAQSVAARQRLPSVQRAQEPPQSTSVSSPFLIWSVHDPPPSRTSAPASRRTSTAPSPPTSMPTSAPV